MAVETLTNPFEVLSAKLDKLLDEVATLKEERKSGPVRVPFLEFCRMAGISKPTGYAWLEKGLVRSELIGGRRFVIHDGTLTIPKKYDRAAAV